MWKLLMLVQEWWGWALLTIGVVGLLTQYLILDPRRRARERRAVATAWPRTSSRARPIAIVRHAPLASMSAGRDVEQHAAVR